MNKKILSFPAIIHQEGESSFGASFPDLAGCVSASETLPQAIENAQNALALHISGMLEDGQPVPLPSEFDDVAKRPEKGRVAVTLLSAAQS